jgi:tetratricopeptide (TPR) repeat protein
LKGIIYTCGVGEEAFKVSEAVGNVRVMAYVAVLVLGQIAMELRDYKEAERQFEQGLGWYVEFGDSWAIVGGCSHLGKVALLTQNYEKATSSFRQALEYYNRNGQRSQEYYETLVDISVLCAAQGNRQAAVELLSLVQRQEKNRYIHDLATASLTELETTLPPEFTRQPLKEAKHSLAIGSLRNFFGHKGASWEENRPVDQTGFYVDLCK